MINVIVDAFGGDNAPAEVLKGCKLAQEELHVDIQTRSLQVEVELHI